MYYWSYWQTRSIARPLCESSDTWCWSHCYKWRKAKTRCWRATAGSATNITEITQLSQCPWQLRNKSISHTGTVLLGNVCRPPHWHSHFDNMGSGAQ